MATQLIQKLSDSLAAQSSRRGFLRIAAKATGAVTAVGFGLTRIKDVAAEGPCTQGGGTGGCVLAYPNNPCPGGPSCPSGETNPWSWYCCLNSCLYFCLECYDNRCSTAYSDGSSCGGGTCGGTRAPGKGAATPKHP